MPFHPLQSIVSQSVVPWTKKMRNFDIFHSTIRPAYVRVHRRDTNAATALSYAHTKDSRFLLQKKINSIICGINDRISILISLTYPLHLPSSVFFSLTMQAKQFRFTYPRVLLHDLGGGVTSFREGPDHKPVWKAIAYLGSSTSSCYSSSRKKWAEGGAINELLQEIFQAMTSLRAQAETKLLN